MTEKDRPPTLPARLGTLAGDPLPPSRDPRLSGHVRLGGLYDPQTGRPPGTPGAARAPMGSKGKFKPTFGGIKRPAVKKEPTNGAGGSQRSDGNMSNEDFLLLMDKAQKLRDQGPSRGGYGRGNNPLQQGGVTAAFANANFATPAQANGGITPSNGRAGRGHSSSATGGSSGGWRRADTEGQKQGLPSAVKLEDMDIAKDELADDMEERPARGGATEWDYSQYYPEVLPLRRPNTQGPSEEEALPSSIGYVPDEAAEAKEDTAGQLGLLQSAEEGGGELMLFQLPSALPMPPLRRKDGARHAPDGRDAPPAPPAPSLADLPSGKVGKLLVFRSGAVKLQLGDVLLDITACGEAGIQQEVVCINTASAERGQGGAQEGAAIFLGGLHHRVVASPDITQLLEDGPVPDWPREIVKLDEGPSPLERQLHAPPPVAPVAVKQEPGSFSTLMMELDNDPELHEEPQDVLVAEGADDMDLSDGE